MIDFSLDEDLQETRKNVRRFVAEEVMPHEQEVAERIETLEAVRRELQDQAKKARVFLPHLPEEIGGQGLGWREIAVVLEEAGRSLLGPQALNVAAPDEGNMHLLFHAATGEQKERYLKPLARGEIRSCFCMTERPPGAGSDPSLLRTAAEKTNGRWQINGAKWYITGAKGAALAIVLAQTPKGPTMFLVDANNPGFRVDRIIPTMDMFTPGGHAEVVFAECEVDDSAVLGEVGKGFEYAQIRLAPARLTHCMRWLGIAERAMEIATAYALERDSFDKKLSEHQGVQFMVADSHTEMHAARLMIWHAAWLLDKGEQARHESSISKVFVSETVYRVVDRALQICGSLGVSEDIPLSHFYREVRPFRIYDGPSEVHRASVGRRIFSRATEKCNEGEAMTKHGRS